MSIIARKELQIFIFDSCAAFQEKSMSLIEEMKGDRLFAFAEVDNSNVVVRKGTVDIGNDFGLGHLLIFGLNGWEVQ